MATVMEQVNPTAITIKPAIICAMNTKFASYSMRSVQYTITIITNKFVNYNLEN